jgi:O-antigen ligase
MKADIKTASSYPFSWGSNLVANRWTFPFFILLIFFIEIIIGVGILKGKSYYILASFLSLFLSIAVFSRPEWGIVLMPNIANLQFGPVNKLGFSLLDVFVIITAAGLFFSNRQGKEIFFQRYHFDLPILLFLGWAFLSIVWAPGTLHGLPTFVNLLLLFITFYVSLHTIKTKKVLNYIIGSWIILALINCVVAIGSELLHPGQGRKAALSFNVHTFALLLIYAIYLTIGKYKTSSHLAKLFFAICIVIMLFGLVLTGSRGGWIGFFFGAAILYLSSFFTIQIKNDLIKKAFGIIAVFFIFILLIAIFFVNFGSRPAPPKRVSTQYSLYDQILTLTYVDKEGGFAWRRALWKVGIKLLSENQRYLIGFGIGGWADYSAGHGIEGYFQKKGGNIASIHNFYFTVLLDFGIIGLLLYLWIFKRYLTGFWVALRLIEEPQKKKEIFSFVAGFGGFAVFAITNHSYLDEMLWLYLAHGIGMIKIYSQPTNSLLENKGV